MFLNIYCVPQQLLCSSTTVVFFSNCCVLQQLLCSSATVVFFNNCCVLQHVLCSSTCIVFLNMYCVPQHVFCSLAAVVFLNIYCVPQRLLCSSTSVVLINNCCVTQRLLCYSFFIFFNRNCILLIRFCSEFAQQMASVCVMDTMIVLCFRNVRSLKHNCQLFSLPCDTSLMPYSNVTSVKYYHRVDNNIIIAHDLCNRHSIVSAMRLFCISL